MSKDMRDMIDKVKSFGEFKNKTIFVRNDVFDNSGTIRKLPYEGIQCWCIYDTDFEKYIEELELWGGRRKNVSIVSSIGYKIFALDYPKAHKYVMGESDEIPELESFNEQKHRLKYIKQGEKSMLAYISEMKYQIFLIK